MRGGYLHNRVLLEPIANHFRRLGAGVSTEHRVEYRHSAMFADLVVDLCGQRIVVEAELSPSRVGRDVDKAAALGAGLLLIVTPTGAIASACRRRLADVDPLGVEICVLMFSAAMREISNRFPLNSGAIPEQKSIPSSRRG